MNVLNQRLLGVVVVTATVVIGGCSGKAQNDDAVAHTDGVAQLAEAPTPRRTVADSLLDEAKAFGEGVWRRNMVKCGDSYVWKFDLNGTMGDWVILQAKGEPVFSVDGAPVTPAPLSEADRLNGVRQNDVTWMGHITIQFPVFRTVGYHDWRGPLDWENNFKHWAVIGKTERQGWSHDLHFLPITCEATAARLAQFHQRL